ncbi:MAG: phytanoyl-CoA dioxygenase family protein [Acetobacteraceae bacterium]
MSFIDSIFRRLSRARSMPPLQGPGEDRRHDPITFADLSEMPDTALLPRLDQPSVDECELTKEQRDWRANGVLILPGLIPSNVLDPYIARREALRTEKPDHFLGGWYSPNPYEHVPELRSVCLYPPLMRMMEHVLGEPMMLHLNLTGWVSTERNWHQDDYLNPGFVNSWYAAVWIALDTIDPDSGPFEYVEGSHRWPLMRQDRVLAQMTEEAANERCPMSGSLVWPRTSEAFVVPAIEAEITARGGVVRQFLAKKGDVLIWHGRTIHRGSLPRVPGSLRRSLIAHYSGINHRPDFVHRAQDENGGWYYVANSALW